MFINLRFETFGFLRRMDFSCAVRSRVSFCFRVWILRAGVGYAFCFVDVTSFPSGIYQPQRFLLLKSRVSDSDFLL